jgi:putative MATE family efflux protein
VKTCDMTQGNPMRLLLLFAIPVLAGNVFQQFYNMVDSIIVGQFVGVDALAAVGSTGSLMFLIIGFSMGLTVGYSMIISQRFGAGDEEGVRKAVALSIVLSLVIGIFITILGVLVARPLLVLMQSPPETLEDATTYLTMMFVGVLAGVYYNLFSSVLRALGDARTPLYFLILSSLLNVVLDLVFVICFYWGVFGVALATVLAQLFSAIVSGIYMFTRLPILRLSREDFRWDPFMVRELVRMGLPAAFQNSVISLGVLVLQVVVNTMGAQSMAAYTSATKIHQVASQTMMSVGVAIGTFVGQNKGAERYERIRIGVRCGLVLTTVIGIIGCIVMHLFSKPLVSLFVSAGETEVLNISSLHLHTISYFYILLGALFVYRYALQGMGNAMIPMFSSFMEIIVRVPICLLFYGVIHAGYVSVPIADSLTWTFTFAFLCFFFYRVYRQEKLVKDSMPSMGEEETV